MFIVRIQFDPFLKDTLLRDLGFKKGQEQVIFEPLCNFSNSAMNVELVYIILAAVQKFFDKDLDIKNNLVKIDKDAKAI